MGHVVLLSFYRKGYDVMGSKVSYCMETFSTDFLERLREWNQTGFREMSEEK